MSVSISRQFTVYYDGACPLCRQEIAFYQRRKGAEHISWVDVSNPDNTPPEISCAEALARFHVRTCAGDLKNGGAAFAALWQRLPAFRWLGLSFSVPPLLWVLNLGYDLFLPIRPHLQSFAMRSASTKPDPRDVP